MNDLQTEPQVDRAFQSDPRPDVSMTHLVSGILTDAQKLIEQQLSLLRHELKDDLRKTKEAGLLMTAGAVIGLVGGILLAFMLVNVLSWAFPGLQHWVYYGIVGAPFSAFATLLFLLGIQKLNSFNPLSDQSAQALKENLQWKTNPK
jgi:Flp pilus assembly protein TadB